MVAVPGFPATAEPEQRKHPVPRFSPGWRAQGPAAVLVADAEPATRRTVRRYLESAGYKVIEASNGRQAVGLLSESVAAVILDLFLPEVSGMDCLRQIRRQFADVQVIVTCGCEETHDAMAAIGEGAFQYLAKPLGQGELLAQIRQAVCVWRLARENHALQQALCYPLDSTELVGSSGAMRSVRKQIKAFAQLDTTVLITGAGGTGKTTVAHWIHRHGPRAARPLAAVHCGALPSGLAETGLFGYTRETLAGAAYDCPGGAEIAHGGTLLLDEVGELPMELQGKLLRFLQDRVVTRVGSSTVSRVDVRVVATSRRNLAGMCRDGGFREDLFFRLNVLKVQLPALKQCSGDLPELAYEILRRIARSRDCPPPVLTDDAMQILQQHDWPGNVSELEHVLQRATALSDVPVLRAKDLVIGRRGHPGATAEQSDGLGLAGMTMAEIERCAVIETIRSTGGNKAKAARQLDVSEKTIYNKIKQYNLRGKL